MTSGLLLLCLLFFVCIKAAGDVLDDLKLVLHCEVQLFEHICLSPNLRGSWLVVKLVLVGSRLEPSHPMDVQPDQLESLLSVHLDDEVIELLYLLVLVLEVGWRGPCSYLWLWGVRRNIQGAEFGGQYHCAEYHIAWLSVVPLGTVLPHDPPQLLHLLHNVFCLLPCPNVVDSCHHYHFHSIWHVEVVFLKGSGHVSHFPSHYGINVEVYSVAWHGAIPDPIQGAAGEHNPPGLSRGDHHRLQVLADGAHVGGVPVIPWSHEHPPDGGGGEVVVS